jgi:hypothetical protein
LGWWRWLWCGCWTGYEILGLGWDVYSMYSYMFGGGKGNRGRSEKDFITISIWFDFNQEITITRSRLGTQVNYLN